MFWKNYGRVLMYDALPRLITIIIIVSVVQVTWRDKRSRWRLQIILLFVVGWRILLHARMSVLFLFKWSVLFIQIFFSLSMTISKSIYIKYVWIHQERCCNPINKTIIDKSHCINILLMYEINFEFLILWKFVYASN